MRTAIWLEQMEVGSTSPTESTAILGGVCTSALNAGSHAPLPWSAPAARCPIASPVNTVAAARVASSWSMDVCVQSRHTLTCEWPARSPAVRVPDAASSVWRSSRVPKSGMGTPSWYAPALKSMSAFSMS